MPNPKEAAFRGSIAMPYIFSERSKQRFKGVHPDLVAVMALALERTPIDFTVLEGVRTLERQKQLVAKGASKTMNSRHLSGHAVDIAPLDADGEVSWSWPLYHQLAPVVKQAAKDLGVDLEWGGDWNTFKDGPHWQLSWNSYNADDMKPRAKLNGAKVVQSAPDDEFAFRPTPVMTPDIIAHNEPEAESQPKTPMRSTTIRAAIGAAAANGGVLFTAWSGMTDTDKMIAAGLTVFVMGCALWIFSERIKKMLNYHI